ncbi:hypothetical protein Nepgr_025972 [Nepenthes gracilis]|uniref:Uncharacterized protein n=1 Tax=Nepenthes gracilis TaxID=150966 RepID=A0AAD3T7J8_NEPGR|nr:hypothetical protein Nepgr_025972 [Nepenthes gracilis]
MQTKVFYQPTGRILSTPAADPTNSTHKEYRQRAFLHTKSNSAPSVKVSNYSDVLHFVEDAEPTKISDEDDLLRDRLAGESEKMSHQKIVPTKRDKTLVEQEIRPWWSRRIYIFIPILELPLHADQLQVSYVALLSSEWRDAALGNLESCLQTEASMQNCRFSQQGGIVEEHQKAADRDSNCRPIIRNGVNTPVGRYSVSYADILKFGRKPSEAAKSGSCAAHLESTDKGERVDCHFPSQNVELLYMGSRVQTEEGRKKLSFNQQGVIDGSFQLAGDSQGQIARQKTTSSSGHGSGGAMKISNVFDVLLNCEEDVPSAACNGLTSDWDQLANVPLAIQDGGLILLPILESEEQKGQHRLIDEQHLDSCGGHMSRSFCPKHGSYVPIDTSSGMKAEKKDLMPFLIEHQRELTGPRNVFSTKLELKSSNSEAARDYNEQQKYRQIPGSLKLLKPILNKPKDRHLSYPSFADLVYN